MKENRRYRAWLALKPEEKEEMERLCREYLLFLNQAKTERRAVSFVLEAAQKAGFVRLEDVDGLEKGQKVIITEKGKVAALVVVGELPFTEGFNIVASHIDAPRLDLKPQPLYEDGNLAFFKTHYYGGIKKYQWTALPLSLQGVVVKKDGRKIEVVIGEEENDPVFTIADLLPHLAKDQMEKKMSEGISGEGLNLLIGNMPLSLKSGEREDKEAVKTAISTLLKEKYDLESEDFISAELEVVPAFKAKEVGLDRSLIGGYGQDDRVNAFLSLMAILKAKTPERTGICLFADKEEIGSTGNTGLRSYVLENMVADLLAATGNKNYYDLRKALRVSHALSADVTAAFDPNYEGVFDKLNSVRLGEGLAISKYTGSRGKYDSSDAHPEFVAMIRRLFDDGGIPWQSGELGKVDQGGGGTVAQYLARYGMEVLDCGVALLGMHSPFEVASKADIYWTYRGYLAFFEKFRGF